jgi:hypothetical protein
MTFVIRMRLARPVADARAVRRGLVPDGGLPLLGGLWSVNRCVLLSGAALQVASEGQLAHTLPANTYRSDSSGSARNQAAPVSWRCCRSAC